jgi:hypothetical protein
MTTPAPPQIDMLRELLKSADPMACAEHSFRNYHAFGVDYLNLLRTDRLTAKLYFMRGNETRCNSRDWLVWPHNHRYAFESFTVSGDVRHIRFGLKRGSGWMLCHYDASTHQAEPLLEVGLEELSDERLRSGSRFVMGLDEIHTIRPADYQTSIFFQIQYHDQRSRSLMFAPAGETIVCGESGLYRSVTSHEARTWIKEARTALEVTWP